MMDQRDMIHANLKESCRDVKGDTITKKIINQRYAEVGQPQPKTINRNTVTVVHTLSGSGRK